MSLTRSDTFRKKHGTADSAVEDAASRAKNTNAQGTPCITRMALQREDRRRKIVLP
jgi:hypothetical protein